MLAVVYKFLFLNFTFLLLLVKVIYSILIQVVRMQALLHHFSDLQTSSFERGWSLDKCSRPGAFLYQTYTHVAIHVGLVCMLSGQLVLAPPSCQLLQHKIQGLYADLQCILTSRSRLSTKVCSLPSIRHRVDVRNT